MTNHRNELVLGFALALVLIVIAVILVTGVEVIGTEGEPERDSFTLKLEDDDRVGYDKINAIADVVIWNHVSALKYATAAERVKQARVEQTRNEEQSSEPIVMAESPHYESRGSIWDSLAQCESGGNWAIATGNGFYGGLQFTLQSWQAVGGSGMPNQASREEQIARGQALQAIQGWGAWPGCAAKLGLL